MKLNSAKPRKNKNSREQGNLPPAYYCSGRFQCRPSLGTTQTVHSKSGPALECFNGSHSSCATYTINATIAEVIAQALELPLHSFDL